MRTPVSFIKTAARPLMTGAIVICHLNMMSTGDPIFSTHVKPHDSFRELYGGWTYGSCYTLLFSTVGFRCLPIR